MDLINPFKFAFKWIKSYLVQFNFRMDQTGLRPFFFFFFFLSFIFTVGSVFYFTFLKIQLDQIIWKWMIFNILVNHKFNWVWNFDWSEIWTQLNFKFPFSFGIWNRLEWIFFFLIKQSTSPSVKSIYCWKMH